METMNTQLNELHLFAGAGGGILGGMLCGHTTVCAVEIEPYCRKVLLQRQRDGILPKFPIWDDVRTFDGKPWKGKVDVVCGGFPCQDLSSQSAVHHGMQGLDGTRSGLWVEFARIIGEIRPKFVFVENSPNIIIRGIERVLGDLAEMGYHARWGVLGADTVGLDHKRDRFWLVAKREWEPIKFAYECGECECCGDAWCSDCGDHYGECLCIGPTEDDVIYSKIEGYAKRVETDSACYGLQRRDNFDTKRQRGFENGSMAGLCKNQLRFDIPAPDSFGSPNGMADRVERTKAIGNGQVPAVAALAWNILKL